MSKAEVETLLFGKTAYWTRPGSNARWHTTMKADYFYFSSGGPPIAARYTIDDSGKLCYKWMAGTLPDACRVYAKVGDQVRAFDPADLATVTSQLERIE